VTLTGGAGFLGSHLAEQLRAVGCDEVFVPRSRAASSSLKFAIYNLPSR